jgi:1-acyl-sn-glycerol-3-phosphate acyltransferase
MNAKRSFQLTAFLRTLFLIFSAAIYTCILAPPAFTTLLLDRSGRWFSALERTWANWLLHTNGIHLNVQRLENLERGHSYILISNHVSILDIPGIICALPFPVRFIAKRSLIWFPIFGWILYLAGHILIERESAQSALKSLKQAASLLKNGTSIMVFAEGTRSPDGQVKEFKGGAFLLALKVQAPVVPISISGTYEMLPRTGWCFWPGTIKIYVSRPIPTQGLSQRQARSLMEQVRETVIQNLQD